MKQTMQKKGEVNGVDVDRLFETIDQIKGTPVAAKFRFRNTNRWIEGGHNRSMIKGFYGACQEDMSRTEPFVFDADEPPVLLGMNRGANPVEFVLHALAGCMTSALVYHAAARGIVLETVTSQIEGDIDLHGFLGMREDVPPGYQNIRVTFEVDGDFPDEMLEDLCQMTRRHSPVFDTVTRAVNVDVGMKRSC
jgi:uncharacterized OsmC-like protein